MGFRTPTLLPFEGVTLVLDSFIYAASGEASACNLCPAANTAPSVSCPHPCLSYGSRGWEAFLQTQLQSSTATHQVTKGPGRTQGTSGSKPRLYFRICFPCLIVCLTLAKRSRMLLERQTNGSWTPPAAAFLHSISVHSKRTRRKTSASFLLNISMMY